MRTRSARYAGTKLTSPAHFAAALVTQAIEVLLGHRPPRHLQSWLHPEVYDALVRRAGLALRIAGRAAPRQSPRIRRIVVCEPRPRVAEVSLVVFDGLRIRAAAVRLEIRRERWHVTALEII
ncbi:Rv3235 family protein [Trueperella sp. LYQ141]|uniref:Rv3235 family protein n=1 Tax=Trueperella sp. LYQ141 TaxID=3391058 RepID=UPI003983DA47